MTETKSSEPARAPASLEPTAPGAVDGALPRGEGARLPAFARKAEVDPSAPGASSETPADATADAEGASTPPLFRRGNPLRLVRGGCVFAVGSFLAFLLMANVHQLRWGVPLGS